LPMHELFLRWFNQMPLVCQQKLARIAWFLLTDDISDMALSSEEILKKFKNYISSADFPIRKAAQMIMILALFDSIMENLPVFLNITKELFEDAELEKKLVNIEEKMWEKIREGWNRLRNVYYSVDLISIALEKLEDRRRI